MDLRCYLQIVNVNKQKVLHTHYPEIQINKYDQTWQSATKGSKKTLISAEPTSIWKIRILTVSKIWRREALSDSVRWRTLDGAVVGGDVVPAPSVVSAVLHFPTAAPRRVVIVVHPFAVQSRRLHKSAPNESWKVDNVSTLNPLIVYSHLRFIRRELLCELLPTESWKIITQLIIELFSQCKSWPNSKCEFNCLVQ